MDFVVLRSSLKTIQLPTSDGLLKVVSRSSLKGLRIKDDGSLVEALAQIRKKVLSNWISKSEGILLSYPFWDFEPELLWPETLTEVDVRIRREEKDLASWKHIRKMRAINGEIVCSRGIRKLYNFFPKSSLSEIQSLIKCFKNESNLAFKVPAPFATFLSGTERFNLVQWFDDLKPFIILATPLCEAEVGFLNSVDKELKSIGVTGHYDLNIFQFKKAADDSIVLLDLETSHVAEDASLIAVKLGEMQIGFLKQFEM